MLGEIRLAFFVNGIGYHKECSELLYTIDSSTDSRYFKEGQILEIDHVLFKVQEIELQFIPLPWEKNSKSEKPDRDKPIKIVYVSKAKVSMMGEKSKKSAVRVSKLPKIKPLPEFDFEKILADTEYTREEFKDDFDYLEKPVKKTRKKKEEKRIEKKDIASLKALKKKKTKAIPEKKEEKPVRNMRRRARTVDMLDMFEEKDDKKAKKGSKTVKKAGSKAVVKKKKKTAKKGK